MMRGLRCAAFAAGLSLVAAARAEMPDLGVFFGDEKNWGVSASVFSETYQAAAFHFVDEGCAVPRQREELRFLGLEVWDAQIFFKDKGAEVSKVRLSLYNKGDAGRRDRETFEAFAETVKKKIAESAGEPGMTGKLSNDRPNYFIKRHQWIKKMPGVALEWAWVEQHRSEGKSVPYSAEFVAVTLVSSPGDRLSWILWSVRENVTRNPAGDVWIANIPMVDQGQKGYCAAAASERVLRYYGIEVDQHQIAQLADTVAEGGTTLEGMARAVSKVGKHFQLDTRELIPLGTDVSFAKSEHAKLLDDYNAVARMQGAPQLDWGKYTKNHVVDILSMWKAMNPAILLTARNGQKQAMGQFVKNITLYADQGVPLLWSCLVGLYPETPPLDRKGAFGHVRLIVGYNTQTKEILYSDSWGPDHALKRLPLEQAWAMTKGLIVLKPRGVR
ncbi:MAG: hypothetical protein LBW77_02180, partial [Verrucomicrobiota bacterium]|jgi:hypothetical protein|nr:hypothetical protein [Verrucomicrobiota bacterium]